MFFIYSSVYFYFIYYFIFYVNLSICVTLDSSELYSAAVYIIRCSFSKNKQQTTFVSVPI